MTHKTPASTPGFFLKAALQDRTPYGMWAWFGLDAARPFVNKLT